jgi:hypothetical protein
MRRARRLLVPALLATLPLALTAACGEDEDAYDRAAGFYTLATVDGRAIPTGVQTVPGGGVFLQRGTMQLHADGRFAIGLEQSFVGPVSGDRFVYLNGRYALTANDSTFTLTTEPDGQVIVGAIATKRITLPRPIARLTFERP